MNPPTAMARAIMDRLRARGGVLPLGMTYDDVQDILDLRIELHAEAERLNPNALLHHTHDPDPESGICRKDGCHAVDYDVYQRGQDEAARREAEADLDRRDPHWRARRPGPTEPDAYQRALGRRPRW